MSSYAVMTPDALDSLDSEERHHIYKMLKLRVLIYPDGALEIVGVLTDSFSRTIQDEGDVLAQDQVEFTVARAVVALHEFVAALQKIPKRLFLAPRPRVTPAQAPTPA